MLNYLSGSSRGKPRAARINPSALIAIQKISISAEGRFHANSKLNKMSDAPARLSAGNRQSVDSSSSRRLRKYTTTIRAGPSKPDVFCDGDVHRILQWTEPYAWGNQLLETITHGKL